LTTTHRLGKIQRSAKAKKNIFCNLAIDIDKENCYFDKLARNMVIYGRAVNMESESEESDVEER